MIDLTNQRCFSITLYSATLTVFYTTIAVAELFRYKFLKEIREEMNQYLYKKLDHINDIPWIGGVTNPVTYVERISYSIYLKHHSKEESKHKPQSRSDRFLPIPESYASVSGWTGSFPLPSLQRTGYFGCARSILLASRTISSR